MSPPEKLRLHCDSESQVLQSAKQHFSYAPRARRELLLIVLPLNLVRAAALQQPRFQFAQFVNESFQM